MRAISWLRMVAFFASDFEKHSNGGLQQKVSKYRQGSGHSMRPKLFGTFRDMKKGHAAEGNPDTDTQLRVPELLVGVVSYATVHAKKQSKANTRIK